MFEKEQMLAVLAMCSGGSQSNHDLAAADARGCVPATSEDACVCVCVCVEMQAQPQR